MTIGVFCAINTTSENHTKGIRKYIKGLRKLTTQEIFEKILRDLKNDGVADNAAIVTRDGVLVSSTIEDSESLVAMGAPLVGSAEHAFAELERGVPDRVIVENKNCKLLAMGAGPKLLLLIVANPNIGLGLGLLIIKAEEAVEKIKQIEN